jgi:16S rRNA (cytosine967-C5)-methyltransferase
MIAPARVAAYDVLRAVSSGRLDLPDALARARARLPDERDRALAGEIAAGTLRWQGACDAIIEAFTKRPVSRLDAEVLDILRLTAFQLLHLDRIPASAAVNDAVALTGKVGKKSASGLVNAVLRRMSRERDRLPLPPRPETDEKGGGEYLATTLSHPEWLVAKWLDRYGFEDTEKWALFDNEPAPLTLRANTLRLSRDELAERLKAFGVDTEPTRFASSGLSVRGGNPLLAPIAGDGLFLVQDESSQLVAELTTAAPGERILDACASPGGKTMAMAAAMGDRGLIVATDLRGRRVDLLKRTINTLGAGCVRVARADVSVVLPFAPVFDCVLLDAPCSGLGTLRRDPEIRWRRTQSDLERLATVQSRMLDRVADAVVPGGRIVYATCSSEPEENEDIVNSFLAQRADFTLAPERIPSALSPFVTTDGYFQTLPFRHSLEAFFGAILVKTKDLR